MSEPRRRKSAQSREPGRLAPRISRLASGPSSSPGSEPGRPQSHGSDPPRRRTGPSSRRLNPVGKRWALPMGELLRVDSELLREIVRLTRAARAEAPTTSSSREPAPEPPHNPRRNCRTPPRASLGRPRRPWANRRPGPQPLTHPTARPCSPRATARPWSIWNGCSPMGIAAVQPGAGTAPYASRWPACRTRSRRAAGPGGTRGVRHGGGGGEPPSPGQMALGANLRYGAGVGTRNALALLLAGACRAPPWALSNRAEAR